MLGRDRNPALQFRKVTLDFFLFFQGALELWNPILRNIKGIEYLKEFKKITIIELALALEK